MLPIDLKIVKKRIKDGDVLIQGNALQGAKDDFQWTQADIKRCLLKLKEIHWHKTENHRLFPNTKMDYYKAEKIMEGQDVYTHFYIKDGETQLIISSFHQLIINRPR